VQLTEADVAQFHAEGFVVLPSVLAPDQLDGLRAECGRRLDDMRASMDAVGADTLGLTHRDRRYFLHGPYQESPFLKQFLLGGTMVDIAAALLGPEVYLFLELFVVKPAEVGIPMAWHQDGGYVDGHPHDPYVSLWVALDEMTAANGALRVLPRTRYAASQATLPHVKDRTTNDLVGYDGPDPGDLLEIPAGSIVAMASTLFHRTGENTTAAPRRAFLAAYSPSPITTRDGALWNLAERCR